MKFHRVAFTRALLLALILCLQPNKSFASSLAEYNILLEGNSLILRQDIPILIEDLSLVGKASGQPIPSVGTSSLKLVDGAYTQGRITALQTLGLSAYNRSGRYGKPAPGQFDMILHQEHWPGRIASEAAPTPIAEAGYPVKGYQDTATLYEELTKLGFDAPMNVYSTWGPRRPDLYTSRKVYYDRGMDWDDVILEIQTHGFTAARYAEQQNSLGLGEIGLIPIGQGWLDYHNGPGHYEDLYRGGTDRIHQNDRGALLTAMLVLSAAIDFDPFAVDTDSAVFSDFMATHELTMEDWNAVTAYGSTQVLTESPTAIPSPQAASAILVLLSTLGLRRRRDSLA